MKHGETFPLSFYTLDDHELLRSNLTSKVPDMAKKANTLNPKERRKDPLLPLSTRCTSTPVPAKPTPPPRCYNPQKVGTCLLPVATETETSLGAKLLKRRQQIESAQEHPSPNIISTENVSQRTQLTSQTTDDITKQDGAKMKQIPAPAKPTPPPRCYNPQKVGTCLPVTTETEDDEEPLTSLSAKRLKRRQKIESAQEHPSPNIISTENVSQRTQLTSQTTDDITKQDGAKMKQGSKR